MTAIVGCMQDALTVGPAIAPAVAPQVAPAPSPYQPTRYYRGDRSPQHRYDRSYDRRYDRPYDHNQRSRVYYDRGGLTIGNGHYSFRINF